MPSGRRTAPTIGDTNSCFNSDVDPAQPYSSNPAEPPWTSQLPSNGIIVTSSPVIDSAEVEEAPGFLDETPLMAPPMKRSSPIPRRSYIIRTKWHTPLVRFQELVQSLPDGGNGVVLALQSLPWQKYITMLTPAEVEQVCKHEIVANVEPDLGFPLAEEIQRY